MMSLRLFPFIPSELAVRRGLKTWPRGAGWPVAVQTDHASNGRTPPAFSKDSAADAANLRLAASQEAALQEQTGKMEDTESREMPSDGEWDALVVCKRQHEKSV